MIVSILEWGVIYFIVMLIISYAILILGFFIKNPVGYIIDNLWGGRMGKGLDAFSYAVAGLMIGFVLAAFLFLGNVP